MENKQPPKAEKVTEDSLVARGLRVKAEQEEYERDYESYSKHQRRLIEKNLKDYERDRECYFRHYKPEDIPDYLYVPMTRQQKAQAASDYILDRRT